MKVNLWRINGPTILGLWLTCLAQVNAAEPDTGLLDKIIVDLQADKLVIVYQMLNADRASEQYADWFYYLDEFSSANESLVQTYSANAEINKMLSRKGLNTSDSYTLFLFDKQPGYFYAGVIVEPMVYFAVQNSYVQGLTTYQSFLPDKISITLE